MSLAMQSTDKLTIINTIEELHFYLKEALVLEHATIPPYLTALYSIKPGTNLDARNILRVVAVEEMLHLTLVANVLNAVGGTPSLTYAGFVPTYPTYLPNGETDFQVSLMPFSKEAVNMFIQIERPAKKNEGKRLIKRMRRQSCLARLHHERDPELHFYSIGEFYEEIIDGLDRLYEQLGDDLFCGDPKRQITPDYYYSGGGTIIPVVDIESAKAALHLIVDQGEGHGGSTAGEDGEFSHYYRFQQLRLGQYYRIGDAPNQPTGERFEVDWGSVYPVKTNAKVADYPLEDAELYAAAKEFNNEYFSFLKQLEEAFTGRPEILIPAVGKMFQIKELANALMRNPIPEMEDVNAAPTFEVGPPTGPTR